VGGKTTVGGVLESGQFCSLQYTRVSAAVDTRAGSRFCSGENVRSQCGNSVEVGSKLFAPNLLRRLSHYFVSLARAATARRGWPGGIASSSR
jgi:hypothetical protein